MAAFSFAPQVVHVHWPVQQPQEPQEPRNDPPPSSALGRHVERRPIHTHISPEDRTPLASGGLRVAGGSQRQAAAHGADLSFRGRRRESAHQWHFMTARYNERAPRAVPRVTRPQSVPPPLVYKCNDVDGRTYGTFADALRPRSAAFAAPSSHRSSRPSLSRATHHDASSSSAMAASVHTERREDVGAPRLRQWQGVDDGHYDILVPPTELGGDRARTWEGPLGGPFVRVEERSNRPASRGSRGSRGRARGDPSW